MEVSPVFKHVMTAYSRVLQLTRFLENPNIKYLKSPESGIFSK